MLELLPHSRVKQPRVSADEPVVARRSLIVLADLALARSDRPGLRVLFVGNSFTFRNDLPRLVHRLGSPAHPIFAISLTAPGWTLKKAIRNRALASLLDDVRWDGVVLQEQSQIPSLPREERARQLDPYARELNEKI